MKGTRLWQDARSPLISGRSRSERPFWQSVFGGWCLSVALIMIAAVVVSLPGRRETIRIAGWLLPRTLALMVGGFSFAVVPAAIGSMAGVWLAKQMGWHHPWLAGTTGGLLAGLVWMGLSVLEIGR